MIKIYLLVLLLTMSFLGAYAQVISVKGVVLDSASGTTMVGVNIVQKGTTHGAVTDVEGKFSISVPSGSMLVFNFVGYQKVEKVASENMIVKMQSLASSLDEVIVIGYSTQKKSDKTGAVSNITSEDFNGGVLTDPIQAVQGKVAGVSVTKKGGDPNAGFSIRIRGASGFDSNTQPLFVVDGVPGVDPTLISPEDIESYNILKDAASTAIYGSRGSNGVVIITTKSGTFSNSASSVVSKVEFSSQLSFEQVAKRYELFTADQLRTYVSDNGMSFTDGNSSTDWQDQIFRNGVSASNNLSFSGGNSTSSFYGSITRSNWTGVMVGTAKDRTNAKLNVNHQAFDGKLRLSGGISSIFENNDYENYDGWDADDIIYQALTRNPTDPVYDDNGDYYQISRVFNYENPMAVINEITNTRNAKKFLGNFKADYNVFKGMTLSANIGYILDDYLSEYFRPADLFEKADNGYGRKEYGKTTQKIMELTGNYTKTFNDVHNLQFLGGYSYQETMYQGFYAQGSDAQSDYAGPGNLAILKEVNYGSIGSWKGKWNLIGFFARAEYDYMKKYYAKASIRRDGSSKFGSNNKWGWFPTAAIGWNIDQESFMDNFSNINRLKLRASFGVSGNQEIGEYHSIVVWQVSGIATNPETGEEVLTFSPAWNANPDLKWETTTEYNLGMDFEFYNSRLSGSLELYKKTTTDLLGRYSVPVPPNLASTTFANSGSLSNTGIELFLQAFVIDKRNFDWKTTFNVAHNKSKILDLGEYFNEEDGVRKEGYISGRGMVGDNYYLTGIIVGEEIGAFYLPEYVGIIDGKFVYVSKDGGYTNDLSLAARTIVGCAAPKVELGWSNSFTLYKNWNVDFSFRAMLGNKVYNATEMFFSNPNNLPSLNASSSTLDWVAEGLTNPASIADIYLEDASFLRLDFVSVSYDFKLDKKSKINGLKLFVAGNNLLLITGYSGIDPETTISGLSFGIDQYNVYPKTKSVTFGLKATF